MRALTVFMGTLAVLNLLVTENVIMEAATNAKEDTPITTDAKAKESSYLKGASALIFDIKAKEEAVPSLVPKEEVSLEEVEGCPYYCQCKITYEPQLGKVLIIEGCSRDPTADLSHLITLHNNVVGVEMSDANLSNLPCKALILLKAATFLNISGNMILDAYCERLNGWVTTLILRRNNMETITYRFNFLYNLKVIDLSDNNITDIPCDLGLLGGLDKFYLSNNSMYTLPCDLSRMKALSEFRLDHNQFETLPCSIGALLGLRVLDVSYNKIMDVSCELSGLRELHQLNLSHNQLKVFPCNITSLSCLWELDVSQNQIQSIPCALSILSGLVKLNLSHNQLDGISGYLEGLHELENLDLSYNNLKAPACDLFSLSRLSLLHVQLNLQQFRDCNLSWLSSLEHLDLSHNRFSVVPQYVLSLKGLLSLKLSYNFIQSIPGQLITLNNLGILDLSNNLIHDIPLNLSLDSKLTDLDLSHNKLKIMPCKLAKLLFSEKLNLSYNQMETLDCDFSSYPIVPVLDLSYNHITMCPHIISNSLLTLVLSHNLIDSGNCNLTGSPTYLKTSGVPPFQQLALDYNTMKTFPCEIALSEMHKLILSHNEIATVSCELSQMSTVKMMLLDHNMFSSVPCNLSTAPVLEYLDLSHNHIMNVSVCLRDFPHLITIILDFNKISVLCNGSLYGSQNLATISLMNNNLRTIEADVFLHFRQLQNLYSVHLENNRLQKPDSWPIAFSKQTIFFVFASNNTISKFSNQIGLQPYSCSKLDGNFLPLDDNNISHIMDVFNGWNIQVSSTEEIYKCMTIFEFGNNPLVCDCIDYDIYETIHNLKDNIWLQNLQCEYPPDLKGQNPTFIPLDRFVCDIQEKCPDGCSCYYTPHSANISVICSEFNETGLPEVLPKVPNSRYSYYLNWKLTKLEAIIYKEYLSNVIDADFSHNAIDNVMLDALFTLSNSSKLYLNNNRLQRLPNNITLVTLGQGTELKLINNPWACDCYAVEMRNWLIANKLKIPDAKAITCFTPSHLKGKQMIYLDESVLCPISNRFKEVLVIAVLGGIIFLLLFSLPLVCIMKLKLGVRAHKRKDWEPVHWEEEEDEDKEFDIFVSYSNEDEEYVGQYLIPELENIGFKVCFHRVHFLAGKSIIDNISECIAKSKKVVACYSMNYSKSEFGMYEYTLAMQLDIQNATNRLVTIIDENLDIENLQMAHSTYLRTHSYVIKAERDFWRNLLYSLPNRKLGEVVEESEGDAAEPLL